MVICTCYIYKLYVLGYVYGLYVLDYMYRLYVRFICTGLYVPFICTGLYVQVICTGHTVQAELVVRSEMLFLISDIILKITMDCKKYITSKD